MVFGIEPLTHREAVVVALLTQAASASLEKQAAAQASRFAAALARQSLCYSVAESQ